MKIKSASNVKEIIKAITLIITAIRSAISLTEDIAKKISKYRESKKNEAQKHPPQETTPEDSILP